jgi:hypothetical protein
MNPGIDELEQRSIEMKFLIQIEHSAIIYNSLSLIICLFTFSFIFVLPWVFS